MGYLAIYGFTFFVFFVYTGYWVKGRNEIQRFFWQIFRILALKNVHDVVMVIDCVADSEVVGVLGLGLYLIFVSVLFNFFINVSLGVLFGTRRYRLVKTLLMVPLNVTLILYYYYSFDTFGPFLVVVEGVVFLFIVKKTLNIIGVLYSYLHVTPDLEFYLQFHSIFLSLIYLYFIEDLVKICTISLFTRFEVHPSSILWEILTALHQFISSLSTLLIFQQIKALPVSSLPNRIPFFQASLTNTLTPSLANTFLIDTCSLIIAIPYIK